MLQSHDIEWIPDADLSLYARVNGVCVKGEMGSTPRTFKNGVRFMILRKVLKDIFALKYWIGTHHTIPITRLSYRKPYQIIHNRDSMVYLSSWNAKIKELVERSSMRVELLSTDVGVFAQFEAHSQNIDAFIKHANQIQPGVACYFKFFKENKKKVRSRQKKGTKRKLEEVLDANKKSKQS